MLLKIFLLCTELKFERVCKTVKNAGIDVRDITAEDIRAEIERLGTRRIRLNARGKEIFVSTDEFTVKQNVYSDKGRKKGEVNARIKAIPQFEKILKSLKYDSIDTEIRGLENATKKGVKAIHRFVGTYEGYDVEAIIRDKGKNQFLYEIKFIENKKVPNRV